MEVGSGLGHDERRTRPADVLVPNWDLGKPAAFDLTVASLLNQSILNEACVTAGSSAQVSEQRKHASNDVKCSELGCIRWQLGLDTFNGSMCPFCPVPLHLVTLQLSAGMGETSSYATSIYAMWSPILAAMLILVNVPWSLKMSGVGVDLCSPNSGNWGKEAQGVFTRLASHLAITLSLPKTSVLADISGRLNVTLVRCIARAILAWKGRSCLPD